MFRGTKIRMEKQNKKIYQKCCKTKRQWVDIFKVLERKKEEAKKRGDSQPRILYLAQISFKNEKKVLFQTNRTKIVINSTTINVRFLGHKKVTRGKFGFTPSTLNTVKIRVNIKDIFIISSENN